MQIKELSKQHEIYLFCLSLENVNSFQIEKLAPFCKEIKIYKIKWWTVVYHFFKRYLFGNWPLQVSLFYSADAQKAYDVFFERTLPDRLFCQMVRTAPLARKYSIYHRTLDYMDCLSMGMKRRMEKTKNPLVKWVLKKEYKRLLNFENECFDYFEDKIIIAEQDKAAIAHPENEKIKVVRNGVDIEYFKPLFMEKKYSIVFVGNMSYPPNILAAKRLVKNILPLVWMENKNVQLLLAGATPALEVKNLQSKQVKVSGWLDDIRVAYSSSEIFVAPMEMGSGLQNKVLEAMACGLPCIISSLANKAIGAADGVHLIIADSNEAFAQHVLTLLEKPELRKTIGKNAIEFVQVNYKWTRQTKVLENIICAED